MLELAFAEAVSGTVGIVLDGNVHPTNDLGDPAAIYEDTYEYGWSLNHPVYPIRLLISTAGHDFTDGTMPPGEIVTAQPFPDPVTFTFTVSAQVPVGAGTTRDNTSLYLWYDDVNHYGSDWFISLYNVYAASRPRLRPGKYTKRGHFN